MPSYLGNSQFSSNMVLEYDSIVGPSKPVDEGGLVVIVSDSKSVLCSLA